jgi:hypothetical protein
VHSVIDMLRQFIDSYSPGQSRCLDSPVCRCPRTVHLLTRCYWQNDIEKVLILLCCQFCGCISNRRRTEQDLSHPPSSFVSGFGGSDVSAMNWVTLVGRSKGGVQTTWQCYDLLCIDCIREKRVCNPDMCTFIVFSDYTVLETLWVNIFRLVAGNIPSSPSISSWRVTAYALKTTPIRDIPYLRFYRNYRRLLR